MKAERAFELPGAVAAQLIEAGHVDLFLQRCAGGEAVGARHHLVRLAAGALLPSLALPARPYRVLAVPSPGAQLLALGDAPADALSALLLSLAAEGPAAWPPGSSCWIEPGSTLDLEPGALLSCSQRLAWLSVEAGALQVGAQRLEAGALWPLGAADWASVVTGPARVGALAPAQVPTPQALAALAPWLVDRFDQAWQRIEDRSRQDGDRLLRKAAETQAALGDALTRLTRVAAADTPPRPPEAADSADLLQACRLLEPGTGLHFRAPVRGPTAAPLERLEAIAHSSRLRCRRVVLGGDWWQQDNGPLVGFIDDGQPGQLARPVALRPGRGGRMELHDPRNERPRPVDAELARRIGPGAMQFFAALPEGRLSGWDLLRFGARGLGPDFARLLGASALVGLLGAAAPLVTGRLVDEAIPSADPAGVLALGAALLAAALSSLLFGLARAVAQLRIEGRMDGALQAALWDRVLSLPAGFFRRFAAGDLALRINGINTLRQGLSGAVVSTLLAGLFSACNLLVLLWLAPGLAAVALALIVLALAVSFTGGVLKLRSERLRAALAGRISGMVHEYLGGIVKLRLCAAEARAFANWALQYTRLRALMLRSMRVTTLEQTFFGGYAVLVSAALFALVGLQQFDDARAALSPGAFITFNAAFGVAFAGLMDLAMTAMGLLVLVPAYERLRPILDALPESPGGSGDPGEPSGDIEVQQLGFAYAEGGPEVLSDVSFRVRPGEFVAIVGPSGSGKSTLLRLLLGFEQARRGSVCFDGRNLLDLDADALRRQLGVVLQSGQLLSGDVFSNIAGVSGATLEQAWEAARLCGLEDDIQAMPMGMHTVIGEGSSTLSGGQRQRILIARAIVARPRILFLDEATSALDNRSQRIVAESLARLRATRIVIAHRLSTIVQADRILVLQDGRLVQSGNYAELAAQPGLFAELVQRQQA